MHQKTHQNRFINMNTKEGDDIVKLREEIVKRCLAGKPLFSWQRRRCSRYR